jgi:hypothetical protein
MSKRQRPCRVSSARTGEDLPYNCDSVIVNVRSLVELLLQLGVALAGPVEGGVVSDDEVYNIEEQTRWERTGHRQGAAPCDSQMWQPCF